jgi:hypothetical protein
MCHRASCSAALAGITVTAKKRNIDFSGSGAEGKATSKYGGERRKTRGENKRRYRMACGVASNVSGASFVRHRNAHNGVARRNGGGMAAALNGADR